MDNKATLEYIMTICEEYKRIIKFNKGLGEISSSLDLGFDTKKEMDNAALVSVERIKSIFIPRKLAGQQRE